MTQNEESPLVKRKVDYNIFVWVIAVLSGTMLTISGYLFSEIAQLRTNLAEDHARSEGSIRELAAKLEAEKDRNSGVQVTLAEIKGNIQNIKDKLEANSIIRR